jgi:hypothetical protein
MDGNLWGVSEKKTKEINFFCLQNLNSLVFGIMARTCKGFLPIYGGRPCSWLEVVNDAGET